MHIEPGIVDGSKLMAGYVMAAGVAGLTLHAVFKHVKDQGLTQLLTGFCVTTVLAMLFFELLPHPSVGVSEVHLIMGATLLLLFGLAPTALGLAAGLLLQGLLFAPADIAQYGMNVTTLLASLFATALMASKVIPVGTRYIDIDYGTAAKLSACFQGSVVTWVAFWTLYGQGVSVATLQSIVMFGVAYLPVVLIEVMLSVSLLAALRTVKSPAGLSVLLSTRLHHA